MKFVRKAVVLLLAAAMLFSFCACASGAEKTVLFSYEGTDFYSGTFSYMLSSEKAYYEQQFAYINYYYSGANLGWSSVLDEETGMTYADAVWESLVLNAKRMVIVNHLLKQYNLKLTDESAVSTIEGYIEQDMEDYGDGNEYGLNLFYADYGVDIDMVRDYYLNNASLSVLRDYLYGDNGIQKIAADAVRESFDEQYYKVESIFFNYYTDTGSTTLKTPEGVTDEAIAEYFKENYVKVRHILFKTIDDSRNPLPDDQIAVKKAEAQELYDRIVAGETTFDDNYSKSEDGGSTTYPDGYVFTYDEMVEEFEEAAFEMEVGEYRLVETSNGWHIMCKEELEDDDIEGTSISGSTKIETACKTALTKKLIGEHTIIISLMNGITSEEIISARYPHKTVIPCVAIGMDAMRSGTELSYVNKGLLQVGITDEKMRPSLKAVDAFLTKTGIPHTVESDIMHAMWNKFMINVGINQACMIYDSPYGGIMSSPEKRASLTRAMREVIALSKAEGTNITEDDFNAAMELFNKLDKNSYPSMHQDFKAKRKSEVELFAGTVRNLAAKHGIPVHENDFYYKRITEIESAY